MKNQIDNLLGLIKSEVIDEKDLAQNTKEQGIILFKLIMQYAAYLPQIEASEFSKDNKQNANPIFTEQFLIQILNKLTYLPIQTQRMIVNTLTDDFAENFSAADNEKIKNIKNILGQEKVPPGIESLWNVSFAKMRELVSSKRVIDELNKVNEGVQRYLKNGNLAFLIKTLAKLEISGETKPYIKDIFVKLFYDNNLFGFFKKTLENIIDFDLGKNVNIYISADIRVAFLAANLVEETSLNPAPTGESSTEEKGEKEHIKEIITDLSQWLENLNDKNIQELIDTNGIFIGPGHLAILLKKMASTLKKLSEKITGETSVDTAQQLITIIKKAVEPLPARMRIVFFMQLKLKVQLNLHINSKLYIDKMMEELESGTVEKLAPGRDDESTSLWMYAQQLRDMIQLGDALKEFCEQNKNLIPLYDKKLGLTRDLIEWAMSPDDNILREKVLSHSVMTSTLRQALMEKLSIVEKQLQFSEKSTRRFSLEVNSTDVQVTSKQNNPLSDEAFENIIAYIETYAPRTTMFARSNYLTIPNLLVVKDEKYRYTGSKGDDEYFTITSQAGKEDQVDFKIRGEIVASLTDAEALRACKNQILLKNLLNGLLNCGKSIQLYMGKIEPVAHAYLKGLLEMLPYALQQAEEYLMPKQHMLDDDMKILAPPLFAQLKDILLPAQKKLLEYLQIPAMTLLQATEMENICKNLHNALFGEIAPVQQGQLPLEQQFPIIRLNSIVFEVSPDGQVAAEARRANKSQVISSGVAISGSVMPTVNTNLVTTNLNNSNAKNQTSVAGTITKNNSKHQGISGLENLQNPQQYVPLPLENREKTGEAKKNLSPSTNNSLSRPPSVAGTVFSNFSAPPSQKTNVSSLSQKFNVSQQASVPRASHAASATSTSTSSPRPQSVPPSQKTNVSSLSQKFNVSQQASVPRASHAASATSTSTSSPLPQDGAQNLSNFEAKKKESAKRNPHDSQKRWAMYDAATDTPITHNTTSKQSNTQPVNNQTINSSLTSSSASNLPTTNSQLKPPHDRTTAIKRQ